MIKVNELIGSLQKEGWAVQYNHVVFHGENPCNGVRMFVCRNGANYLTFVGGMEEVVNATFFRCKQELPEVVACEGIQHMISLMKTNEESHIDK